MKRQMQLQKTHSTSFVRLPYSSPAQTQRVLPTPLTGIPTGRPRFDLRTLAIFPSAASGVEPARVGSARPLVVQRQEITLSQDKPQHPVGQQIRQRIQAACGRGQPLQEDIQHQLEGHLHTNLSRVRVHTDAEAEHLTHIVRAEAFTTGSDIFFQRGRYQPATPQGMRLLAHEATHVAQQAAGSVTGSTDADGISISDPDDRFEQAAKTNAAQISARSSSRRETASQPADHTLSSTTATGALSIQRMKIELPTSEEIETKDYTVQELKGLAEEYPSVKAEIEEAIHKGEFATPQFVTPLFRGVHYKDKKMRTSYNTAAQAPGSTLYSPAAESDAESIKIVQGWDDLREITKGDDQFPQYVLKYYHEGQNLFELLANLYVNDYNAFTSIMPKLLKDFPSIQKDTNPFLSMAERAHISHGYAQHEGKKDKTKVGDLGGIVHGLAVPISYQQEQPLWTNIPSGHVTGQLTIKVRHLPQSEHLAVGSLPGEYNLTSWTVETGKNEKEMNKKAVAEGEDMQAQLISLIEEQGDIPAWLRKSPYTGASHIYFDQPPYTTELERRRNYPLYDKIYTEKTKIQKLIGRNIKKLIETNDEFQEEKQEKRAEKLYNEAQEIVEYIEEIYPGYRELCVQLLQFEGQEKFPPRVREPKRKSAWEDFPSLYSEKELEERAKYHDPSDEMLLKGPMNEIKELLQTYAELKPYYYSN